MSNPRLGYRFAGGVARLPSDSEASRRASGIPYLILASVPAVLFFGLSENVGYLALIIIVLVGALARVVSVLASVAIALPYMFYVDVGLAINLGAVDLLVPVLLAALIMSRDRVDPRIAVHWLAKPPTLAFILLTAIFASAFYSSLFVDIDFNIIRFAMDTSKVVVCVVVFYLMAATFLRASLSEIYKFIGAWVASATAVGTMASIQFLLSSEKFARVTGTFEDPNLFGLYLVVSAGMTLVLYGYTRSKWLWLALLVIVLAVIATASRGALLSLAVFFLACLFTVRIQSAASLALRVGVLVLSIGVLSIFGARIPALERLPTDDISVQSEARYQIWELALSQWSGSPALGIGLGQFAANVKSFISVHVNVVTHNTVLSFLVEMGLIGAVAMALPFIVVVVALIRSLPTSAVAGYLLAVWAAVFTASMTLNVQYSRFVWVLLALSLVFATSDRLRWSYR